MEVGKEVRVLERNRPMGMGGNVLIDREYLLDYATHIIELSVDEVTEGGEGELISKIVARRGKMARDRLVKLPSYLTREWAMWGGEHFSHIYTDGSYKEESSWGEMLLGTPRREAGGAVVLSDGHSWYHHIFVNIDVEVTDAGSSVLKKYAIEFGLLFDLSFSRA